MTKNQLSSQERFSLSLRARELRLVINLIGRKHMRILEIGGGNGWQAHLLQQKGHDVTSIDIAPRTDKMYHPVVKYDGHTLPFEDDSFDIVFSSNVLEHIPHIEAFEAEIHRVLKAHGQAIHVLPTTFWRILTSLTHPFRVIRSITQRFKNHRDNNNSAGINTNRPNWIYALWPNRHGEKGNSLTELYWFSQTAWCRHFRNTAWEIKKVVDTSLAYSGNMAAHMHLSATTRRVIARHIGSSSKIYILTHTIMTKTSMTGPLDNNSHV